MDPEEKVIETKLEDILVMYILPKWVIKATRLCVIFTLILILIDLTCVIHILYSAYYQYSIYEISLIPLYAVAVIHTLDQYVIMPMLHRSGYFLELATFRFVNELASEKKDGTG